MILTTVGVVDYGNDIPILWKLNIDVKRRYWLRGVWIGVSIR